MSINKFVIISSLLIISSLAQAAGNILPNKSITPGEINPRATKELLCSTTGSNPDYATGTKVRDVTAKVRSTDYKNYGLVNHKGYCALSSRGCELDHLISKELGGADTVANTWPQSYGGNWNAVDKDRVENKLGKMVCLGTISLADAQKTISTDWIAAYKRFYGDKYK